MLFCIWLYDPELEIGKLVLWKAGVIFLGTFLFIWAMRILVKLLLSNSHLSADADERIAMIQTYLALLEEGKLDETDGRRALLAAIFRPTTTGVIKDEGMPPVAGQFTDRLQGKV